MLMYRLSFAECLTIVHTDYERSNPCDAATYYTVVVSFWCLSLWAGDRESFWANRVALLLIVFVYCILYASAGNVPLRLRPEIPYRYKALLNLPSLRSNPCPQGGRVYPSKPLRVTQLLDAA